MKSFTVTELSPIVSFAQVNSRYTTMRASIYTQEKYLVKCVFTSFPPICQSDSGASWNKTGFVFLSRCLPSFVTCCSWLRGPCFLLLSLSRSAGRCLQQRRARHCGSLPPSGHLMSWRQWCQRCSGGQWPGEGALTPWRQSRLSRWQNVLCIGNYLTYYYSEIIHSSLSIEKKSVFATVLILARFMALPMSGVQLK